MIAANTRRKGWTTMFKIEDAKTEIEKRNRTRVKNQFPPVAITAELRRMYQDQREQEFGQFFQNSPVRKLVEQKLLNRIRRLNGNPAWKPTGSFFGAWAFHNRTRKIMARIWRTRVVAG
jgi:hypothetical protein